MECALGWPEGLATLIEAYFDPREAFVLALVRHDLASVAHMLSSKCRMFFDIGKYAPDLAYQCRIYKDNMLDLSLCQHCSWHTCSLQCPAQKPLPSRCCATPHSISDDMASALRKLLVMSVKQRRDELLKLARSRLPPARLEELGIHNCSILDSKAYKTFKALQDFGISVPDALYPGIRPLLLSFSIQCDMGGFLLARDLFDNGVCELNVSGFGITPLIMLFHGPLLDGRKEKAISWFLESGAIPTFDSPSMLPNFLFYLATVYDPEGIFTRRIVAERARTSTPEYLNGQSYYDECGTLLAVPEQRKTSTGLIRLVSHYCNAMERDTCQCACSSGGCLPLHKFKNGIAVTCLSPYSDYCDHCHPEEQHRWIPKRWPVISETVLSWIKDCGLDGNQADAYLNDACRLEVFTRLGMAHTCCTFEISCRWVDCYSHVQFPTRHEMDEQERQELQEEDEDLRKQLEAIMDAYNTASQLFQGTREEFWEWWWEILQPLLPEIPATDRRRMFGDYSGPPWIFHNPDPTSCWYNHWCWSYIEEEETVNAGHLDTIGVGGVDFLEEINIYFDKIFAQEPRLQVASAR